MSMVLNSLPERLLLTRREAAAALGLSERTLFDLTKSGAIPHIRLGTRGVRYPLRALEEYIAANTTTV